MTEPQSAVDLADQKDHEAARQDRDARLRVSLVVIICLLLGGMGYTTWLWRAEANAARASAASLAEQVQAACQNPESEILVGDEDICDYAQKVAEDPAPVTPVTPTDGKDGADGADGRPGARGEPGADGAPGTNGTNGAKGDPGADGAAGANGTGKDGAAGFEGKPGAPGEMGPIGPVGPVGPVGATGPTGATGPAGPAGRGITAVACGPTGTLLFTFTDGTTTELPVSAALCP